MPDGISSGRKGYEFTFREFVAAQVELMAEFGSDDADRIKD